LLLQAGRAKGSPFSIRSYKVTGQPMSSVPPTAPTVGNQPAALTRVAVVAVHGVGHHQTGASSDAIANLLSGLGGYASPPGTASYNSFVTHPIQFPLPGANFFPSQRTAPPTRPRGFWSWFGGLFEERRGYFAGRFTLQKWWTSPPAVAAGPDLADEFMKVQLGDYQGDSLENTLRTDRLESHRAAAGGRPAADVHIYDMQWADVGRGDSTFVRFFMSLYQLLIHLISLARIAVDLAALEHVGKWDWFLLQRAHNYCARVLTLFIFSLLGLLMSVAFSPVLLLLYYKGNETTAMAIAAAVFFVASDGAILLLSQYRKPPFGSRGWWHWLFVASTLSIVISALVFALGERFLPAVLSAEWWMLEAALLWYVFRKYEEVRPGALVAGSIAFAAVSLGFVGCVWAQKSVSKLALLTASFWMIQYIFLALRIAWMLFIILAILSLVFECICNLRLRLCTAATAGQKARARAALRTGRFALALPATLTLILHIFLWSGVYHFIAPRVNLFEGVQPSAVPVWPWLQWLVLSPQQTDAVFHALNPDDCREPVWNPYHFLEGLLLQGAPPGFPLVLGFIGVGLALLILMALPSVFFEFRTPFSAPNTRARFLGAWISSGFHSFRAMIWCFWIAAFALPAVYPLVVFGLAGLHKTNPPPTFLETLYESWDMRFSSQLVSTSGALIAGSAALLLGILVKYLSAALDAILDVDTYLRTTPAHNVPRARIVERYVALLRYLHQYRAPEDDNRRGYDRIIIVAHSLGSVISADLLRFLTRASMPALTRFAFADQPEQRLPIFLFTMGNPLRQLLSRFFPHLYRWVREVPDGGGERPALPMLGAPIEAAAIPDPVELGVTQWINYYRSGDYVGRSIWQGDWFLRTHAGGGAFPAGPDIFTDPGNTRVEACIGLGAHTHYWDRTAPDVAIALDAMI
jgi:hypothetical protein